MKSLVIFILTLIPFLGVSQKLVDREGYVKFFSSAPVEDIEAINEKAIGALDLSNGNVAVSIRISAFEFDKSLMKEHFNENYMESEKFPTATFSGKIDDYTDGLISSLSSPRELNVSGKLEIHGESKNVILPVTFSKSENELNVSSVFMVTLEDYDIDIPKVVFMNIAEEVEVTVTFSFKLN